MRSAALGFAVVLAVVGTSGCGYRAGGPYRTDVQTVYVEMFGSREFRRDLEFMLLEAVKKRISMDTPYRLVDRSQADTVLVAEIREERQTSFAPDFQTRQPRDMTLTLAVQVQWKDVRSGRVLVEHPAILQAVDYLPTAGETERLAQERAIDRLAGRIVATMYEEW